MHIRMSYSIRNALNSTLEHKGRAGLFGSEVP